MDKEIEMKWTDLDIREDGRRTKIRSMVMIKFRLSSSYLGAFAGTRDT